MPATKASLWFWSDWDSDPALRICSFAAQGLWMRMLCIAARHDPTGYVAVNRVGLDPDAIARLTGGDQREIRSLIEELERNGVFTRDRYGTIYNRRMVRDEKKRKTAQQNGRKGGNPTLLQPTDDATCRTQTPHPNSKKTAKKADLVSRGNGTRNSEWDNPALNPEVKAGDKLIPIPIPIDTYQQQPTPSARAGPSISANELHRRLMRAANNHVVDSLGGQVVAPIIALLEQGCDLDRHILPAVRKIVPGLSKPLGTWGAKFLREEILALRDGDAARVVAAITDPVVDFGGGVTAPVSTIRMVVERSTWLDQWGPKIGEPGCRVPPDIVALLNPERVH